MEWKNDEKLPSHKLTAKMWAQLNKIQKQKTVSFQFTVWHQCQIIFPHVSSPHSSMTWSVLLFAGPLLPSLSFASVRSSSVTSGPCICSSSSWPGWRTVKRKKYDNTHLSFLAVRVLSTVWEHLFYKQRSYLRHAGRAVAETLLGDCPYSLLSPVQHALTYIHSLAVIPLVDNKSVLETNKWRNECICSSSFLSLCICFFSWSSVLSAASLDHAEITATTSAGTFLLINPREVQKSDKCLSVCSLPPSCSQTQTLWQQIGLKVQKIWLKR